MVRLRVLVADDQPRILEGLRHLLEPEYEIVGEAQNGLAMVAAADRLKPDIIVADITMPRLGGIEAVRRIKKANPKVAVVFLTMHAEPAYATAALKAGGLGFVLKSSAGDELLTAIHEALRGRKFVSPAVAARVVPGRASRGSRSKEELDCPTRRQMEVLRLVARGRTLDEIAEALRISRGKVRFHEQCLMEELQLHTTAELKRYAVEYGFVGALIRRGQ